MNARDSYDLCPGRPYASGAAALVSGLLMLVLVLLAAAIVPAL